VAALAAALLAAAFLPGRPLGVGVFLVALIVALGVWRDGRLGRPAVLYGLPAFALAAMSAVRDAGWVVATDLAAAWVLAAVAVAGPSLAALAGPIVRLRDAGALAPPIPHGGPAAVRGAVLGGLLVLPFGALFWTADAAFAESAQALPLPSIDSLPGRVLTFALVLGAMLGLALSSRRPVRTPAIGVPRPLGFVEWAVPLGLLNALFAAFVAVQFAVLFGGHDHVLETAGLTYAEYARQGFWQLLVAAALTMAVVGATVSLARTTTRRQALSQRALLGVLCLLTLVVLASALRRLELYEDAFGLTRLRLGAEGIGVWLGGIFVLVISAGLARRARRQLRPMLILGTAIGLLAFSLANPDGLIAKRNVQRWRESGKLDVGYLRTLSADAAPAASTLPPALEGAAFSSLRDRLATGDSWSSFNLARWDARRILQG
jgi:hypothetical protein